MIRHLIISLFFFQLSIFFLPQASKADINFIIYFDQNDEDECDFLEIKDKKAICRVNDTALIHSIDSILKIKINNNSQTHTLENVRTLDYVKLERVINNFNKIKLEQNESLHINKLKVTEQNKTKEEYENMLESARHKNAKYKMDKCRDKYSTKCQGDCLDNPYQYKTSCYNSCIRNHCRD